MTKRKKVLFCDNTLWGTLNFRGEVLKHFSQKGFELLVVAPRDENPQMTLPVPSFVRFLPVDMGRTNMGVLSNAKYFFRILRIYGTVHPMSLRGRRSLQISFRIFVSAANTRFLHNKLLFSHIRLKLSISIGDFYRMMCFGKIAWEEVQMKKVILDNDYRTAKYRLKHCDPETENFYYSYNGMIFDMENPESIQKAQKLMVSARDYEIAKKNTFQIM